MGKSTYFWRSHRLKGDMTVEKLAWNTVKIWGSGAIFPKCWKKVNTKKNNFHEQKSKYFQAGHGSSCLYPSTVSLPEAGRWEVWAQPGQPATLPRLSQNFKTIFLIDWGSSSVQRL